MNKNQINPIYVDHIIYNHCKPNMNIPKNIIRYRLMQRYSCRVTYNIPIHNITRWLIHLTKNTNYYVDIFCRYYLKSLKNKKCLNKIYLLLFFTF